MIIIPVSNLDLDLHATNDVVGGVMKKNDKIEEVSLAESPENDFGMQSSSTRPTVPAPDSHTQNSSANGDMSNANISIKTKRKAGHGIMKKGLESVMTLNSAPNTDQIPDHSGDHKPHGIMKKRLDPATNSSDGEAHMRSAPAAEAVNEPAAAVSGAPDVGRVSPLGENRLSNGNNRARKVINLNGLEVKPLSKAPEVQENEDCGAQKDTRGGHLYYGEESDHDAPPPKSEFQPTVSGILKSRLKKMSNKLKFGEELEIEQYQI